MKYYIAALIIIVLSTGMASAFSPGDIEWAAAVSGTLNKGGTLTNGEFMVKAVQFPSPVPGIKDINGNIIPETTVDPMVFLEIYKNGVLIKELIMNPQSEAYIDPDYEVKIPEIPLTGFPAKNARGWVYEYYSIEPPWVTISIQTRAKPKLEVTVTTDKSAYTSYVDNTVTATVTVTNSGSARAKNVDVNLNIGELELRGGYSSQLHQNYNTLGAGTSQSFSVILLVPEIIDQKSYVLSANATGIDVKDLKYKAATGSVTISVSPKQNYFTVSKAVSKDRIYLQNIVLVRITVANSGMFDAYDINVTDSMNDNFELKSNTSLHWYYPVLKAGDYKEMTYSIKPFETNINGFTIPAASAQFTVNNKPYSASSKTSTVIVNGPKIVLIKTVDKKSVNLSDDITVTVSINNVGNIATKARVKDSLPDGVSLVSGSTSLDSTALDLNSPKTFSYTIRMNTEGEIVLPPAVANFTDVQYMGATRAAKISDRPVITVIDKSKITPVPTETSVAAQATPEETTSSPAPVETPEPTPTPITPGFDIAFAVVVLIIAAVLRHR